MCKLIVITLTITVFLSLLDISFSAFSLLPLNIGLSNQTLPPDASPIATPSFDVHPGKCPDIKFDCDSKPIRYYCSSDLACFSWQKCCLYSCSYYCTISVGSGWRNGTEMELENPPPAAVAGERATNISSSRALF